MKLLSGSRKGYQPRIYSGRLHSSATTDTLFIRACYRSCSKIFPEFIIRTRKTFCRFSPSAVRANINILKKEEKGRTHVVWFDETIFQASQTTTFCRSLSHPVRRFYARSRYSANFRTGGEPSSLRGRLSRADIGLWLESLYSAVRADRRGGSACSMAGGIMDDRSRTVFHTINNRYRRPVVNPELSSRGAGRRGTRGRALLSRDQEAIGGPPRAPFHAFEYSEYLTSARIPRSRLPGLSRFRARKGSGREIPRR